MKYFILLIIFLSFLVSSFAQDSRKDYIIIKNIQDRDTNIINFNPKLTIENSDSIYFLLKKSIKPLDSIGVVLKNINTVQNNQNASSSNYQILYIILTFLLFIIALLQYLILKNDRKGYLSVNTFIELTGNPPPQTNTESLLQFYSKLFIQFTNSGNVTIEEIMIKIPETMKFIVENDNNSTYIFKYLKYPEPILPKEKVILYFDSDYFFGDNFKLSNNENNLAEIKFKDYFGKISTKKITFSIAVQKKNVKVDYLLGLYNCVTLKNGELKPLDEEDWNNF